MTETKTPIAEQIKNDLDKSNPDWANIPDSFKYKNIIENEAKQVVGSEKVKISDFTVEDKLTGIAVATEPSLCEAWALDKIEKAKAEGKGFVYSQIDADLLKKLNDALSRNHGDAQIIASAASVIQALNLSELGEGVEAYVFRKDVHGDEFEVWVFGVDQGSSDRVCQNLTGVRQTKYTPTDEVAIHKGYGKELILGCSAGAYSSFEEEEGIDNPQTIVLNAYIKTNERAGEQKVRKSVDRLFNEMRGKLMSGVDAAVDEFSSLYESERVSDLVLENMNRFIAVMSWAEGQDISELEKLKVDLMDSKDADEMFSRLSARFIEIFGEPTTPLIERKTHKEPSYFKGLIKDVVGDGWDDVRSIKSLDGSMDHIPLDTKTQLPDYNRETRRLVVEKITETIREGGVVIIGSIDWDKLKDANNVNFDLGQLMIRLGSANASRSVGGVIDGFTNPPYATLLKRDRAGDETLMVTCIPASDRDKVIDIEKAISEMNGWQRKITVVNDNEQNVEYNMTMSAGLATSLDFESSFNETRTFLEDGRIEQAYSFFEELFDSADSSCKTIKAVKQLGDLPLEDLIYKMNVSDAARRITQVFGGGRLNKESLSFLLKVMQVKARQGRGEDVSTLVEHVFPKTELVIDRPISYSASEIYMQYMNDQVKGMFIKLPVTKE